MVAVLCVIIGAFLGAYINNVFTWKVKGYADAIGILYQDLRKLNKLYIILINIKMNNLDSSYSYTADELEKEIFDITHTLNLYDDIIDQKFNAQIINYIKVMSKIKDDEDPINNYIAEWSRGHKEYKESGKFVVDILKYRKEVTSFCYMIKQLNPFKCNEGK